MKNKKEIDLLRKKAEKVLQQKGEILDFKEFKNDIAKLLEELSIHQIELELQNQDLRNTQNELQQQKEEYETLFNEAPTAYLIFNDTGKILKANQKAASLLGVAPAILKNKPFITFLDNKVFSDFYDHIQIVFATREPQTFRTQIITADKKIKHIEMQSNLWYDNETRNTFCRTIAIDYTDKILLNEKQRKIKKKYQDFSENIDEGIYVTEKGVILDLNTPFAKMFGYDNPKELIGKPTWELASPDLQAQTRELFINKVKINDRSPEIVKCQKKNGETFWASIKMSIFNHDDKVFGTVADVTREKQIQEKLEYSEEVHRLTLSNISDAVFITDENLNFTFVCDNVNMLFGKQKVEVVKMSNLENLIGNLSDEISSLKNNDEIANIPRQIKNSKGEIRDVLLSVKKVNIKKGKYLFTLHDYTDLKKVEKELKKTVERLDVAMDVGNLGWWDWDLSKNKLETAPKKIELLGYEKGEITPSVEDFINMIHPDEYEEAMRAMHEHLQGKRENYDVEYRLKTKSGGYRWLHDKGEVIERFPNGKPKRLLGVIYDIAKQKDAQNLIEQQNSELTELNATKDKFFSIIAHDLKSPFNAILGFSSLLLRNFKKYDNEKMEKMLFSINSSAQNTFKLLENLLLWSRSQRGTLDFKPNQTNLHDFVQENYMLLYENIVKKQLVFENKVDENQEVYADDNMLNTIFRNLISNAIKFTPRGGKISVASELIAENKIQITVQDTGVGIAETEIPKLFDISQNTSTQGTENEQGTGLGLLLIKEFVEKHNGAINVQSKLGEGTKFVFTLPSKKIGA